MPKLQLYIFKSSGSRQLIAQINGSENTISQIEDIAPLVNIVDYDTAQKTLFYIISAQKTGCFIHLVRTIPPTRDNYLDAVIFMSYDTDIMAEHLEDIVSTVAEKISAASISREDMDTLVETFSTDFDSAFTHNKNKSVHRYPTAIMHYGGPYNPSLSDIFSDGFYGKPWSEYDSIILLEHILHADSDSADLLDDVAEDDFETDTETEDINLVSEEAKRPQRLLGNMIWCIIGFILGVLFMAVTSCSLIEYHPYSVNLSGNTNLNLNNAAFLEAQKLTFPVKFAFITDTQGSLDETIEALDLIKARDDIKFIIHGGDISDFGLPKEFIWTRDVLNASNLPYLAVIGNHDCLGNGEDTFDYIFGAENFSMNICHAHFVFLNTVSLEYDYSKPVPDLDFIENDCAEVENINAAIPDSITHTIVVMHSRPYDEQFNNNVAKPFNHYISKYPGLNSPSVEQSITDLSDTYLKCHRGFCINGHNHRTAITDIFDNGIFYYQCANIGKRTFFIFTLTDEGFDCEVVDF